MGMPVERMAGMSNSNVTSIVIVGVGALITVALVVSAVKARVLRRISTPFITLDFERDAAQIRERLPPVDAPPEDRQYALLREYHSRGLAQSTQSFWFSLLAASVGFIVIISAVILAAFGLRPGRSGAQVEVTVNLVLPAIQLISGLVIEAVSALFFVQSNKARTLMADFFDKLREDRKLDESLQLAEKMADSDLKWRLQAVLSLKFSGSVKDELIPLVLPATAASAVVPPAIDPTTASPGAAPNGPLPS